MTRSKILLPDSKAQTPEKTLICNCIIKLPFHEYHKSTTYNQRSNNPKQSDRNPLQHKEHQQKLYSHPVLIEL